MSQGRAVTVLLVAALVLLVGGVVGVRSLVDLADGLRALAGEGVEAPGAPPPEVPEGAQAAEVDRVVDGDTIRVRVTEPDGAIPPTDSVRVRLLNVDAPELDHPERGRDCGALDAKALVERLVPAASVVWLVADVEDRDHYDRPLRAVFNHEGRFVNAELVRQGWAEAVLFPPNDRFYERMSDLEDRARGQRHGAWAACGGFP